MAAAWQPEMVFLAVTGDKDLTQHERVTSSKLTFNTHDE
jgi:hypothetical protein